MLSQIHSTCSSTRTTGKKWKTLSTYITAADLYFRGCSNLIEVSKVLTRPYLMTLYVIFPIHLNFPIRSKCVFKAIINKKQKHILVMICVYCIIPCCEIFLSQDGVFQYSKGCIQKNPFRQPWWWPLVNTSPISQFRENVSSFNFQANTLKLYHKISVYITEKILEKNFSFPCSTNIR